MAYRLGNPVTEPLTFGVIVNWMLSIVVLLRNRIATLIRPLPVQKSGQRAFVSR